MRTALCLSGPVGFLYTNKRSYTWERDIDYRIGYEHYKKHLFDVNDNVDVFIFSWSTDYEDRLDEIYKPKKSKYAEQIDFKPEMKKQSTKDKWCTRFNHKVSRWYGFKQVIQLKSEFEKENNFEYDWVISSRFDEAFMSDLVLEHYPRDGSIYFPWNANFMTHRPRCLEYFYFSDSLGMNKYSTLYDNWEEYGFFDHHDESYHHAHKLGLPIIMIESFKESIDHDLVRAIYKDCEYMGDTYPGVDNLEKLKQYPRGNAPEGGRF